MMPRKEHGADLSPGSCIHSTNILEPSIGGCESEHDMDSAFEGLTVWQVKWTYKKLSTA